MANGKTKLQRVGKAAETVQEVITAQDDVSRAVQAAHILDGDAFAAVNLMVEGLIEKGEEVRAGPLSLYYACDDAGFDFNVLPRVGSKQPKDHEPGSNAVYETFEQESGGEAKEVNWFVINAKATPAGRKWTALLDDLKLAMKPETAKQSKVYASMAGDNAYLKDEVSLYTGRMQSLKTLWKNVAKIRDRIEDLETVSSIELKENTYTDKDGKEVVKVRTKYPFKLCRAEDHSKFTPLSLSDLGRLNVAKAIEAGGKDEEGNPKGATYKGLLDTLAEEAKTTATTKVIIDSLGMAEDYILALSIYFDQETDAGQKHRSALLAQLASKEGQSSLKHYGDFCMNTDSIWTVIHEDYDRLNERHIGNRSKLIEGSKARAA